MIILTQNCLISASHSLKRCNQDPQRLFRIRIPTKIISLPDPRKDNFGSRSPQWLFRIRILTNNFELFLKREELSRGCICGSTAIVQVRSTASVPTTCPGSATRRPMSFSCPTTTYSTTRQERMFFFLSNVCDPWHFGAAPRICTFD